MSRKEKVSWIAVALQHWLFELCQAWNSHKTDLSIPKRELVSSLSTDQIGFPKFFFALWGCVEGFSCHLLEVQQNSEESGGLGGRLYHATVLAESHRLQ